jgi:hypothetical protein
MTGGSAPKAYVKLQREAENYFPLTREKLDLYRQLQAVSVRESLIFTPSVAASRFGIPDNYYPAAITGRQFYLGGYRLRMQTLPGLEERVAFVKSYSPASGADYRRLKSLGVNLVLIEMSDLPPVRRGVVHEAIAASEWYRLVYQNDAGAILSTR